MMSILDRYLTRLFCTMICITIPGLTGIYLLIHFMENVDDFMEAGTPAVETARYFLLLLPGLAFEIAPLAILLAALLSTMLITKNMEMLALRSCGISPKRIAKPFFVTATLLSLLFLLLNLLVIPQARNMASSIRQNTRLSTGGGSLIGSRLYFRGPSSILRAETAESSTSSLKDVRWYILSPDFSMQRMIAASLAKYEDGKWHFHNGAVLDHGKNATFFKDLALRLDATPEDFVAVREPAEEMGIPELFSTVMHMKNQELPCSELETVLWSSLLYPFLGVLLLMVGLPITISRIKGAISLSIGLGMAIGLGTWVVWNLAMILGRSGAIPGFVAPLGVEMVVAGAGLYIMKRTGFTA